MKRYMALLACVFALAACGNQGDDNASNDTQSATGGDPDATSAENGAGNDNGSDTAENDSGGDSANAGFANDQEKRSYALGMDIGNSLKELPVQIKMEPLTQGVRDVIDGNDTKLTQQELDGVMQGFVQDMQAAQKQNAQKQAQTNQQKGEKFLSENKSKEGVETTDSGLQYKVMTKGDGPSPDADDSVTVHYVGKLIDGTVFDSSRDRGEPVTFPVNAVIPGWTEALQIMKQGAKYELYIPADLAYGERGAGAQIGPNETLIFDVELLEVDQKQGAGDGEGGDEAASGAQSDQTDSQSRQAQSSNESSGQSSESGSGQDQTSQGETGQSQSGSSGQDPMSQGGPSEDQSNQSGSGN